MLLELLRLRMRLLRNYALSSVGTSLGLALELALLLGGAVVLYVGAFFLRDADHALTARVAAFGGSGIMAAAFLLPAMAGRPELLDRRALRGYGIRPTALAAMLLPVSLVSPLLVYAVAMGLLPAIIWPSAPVGSAALVAVLLALQFALSVMLGRAVGRALRDRHRALFWVRVVGVAILIASAVGVAVMVLPRAVGLLGPELGPLSLSVIAAAAEAGTFELARALAAAPFGALWIALAPAELGFDAPGRRSVVIAVTTIAVLVLAWFITVALELRATRRNVPVAQREAPSVFRAVSSTPFGAVVARSTLYWLRDPRYRTVLAFLPLIPLVIVLAAWIGGVPFGPAALLPLPLVLLLLGWGTLHNDVAYDSTAMWTLLAAQLDGHADRIGRAIPVLFMGVVAIVIGAPLTVWAWGGLEVLPIVLGVSLAILLGSVGVASIASVRSPYPAPRPGDGAFQQPVVGGAQGIATQGVSLLLILVVAAPSVLCAALWLLGGADSWVWLSFATGIVCGGAAAAAGIRAGAREYNAAAPELLAYTMRN